MRFDFDIDNPVWVVLVIVFCIAAVGFLAIAFPDYQPDSYGRNMNCATLNPDSWYQTTCSTTTTVAVPPVGR